MMTMMSHYKFRYVYSLIIILSLFLLGFHCCLRADWIALQKLQVLRKKYYKSLSVGSRLKPSAELKECHTTQISILSNVQSSVIKMGLNLEKLNVLHAAWVPKQGMLIRLMVAGSFKNCSRLLAMLNKPSSSAVVTDFIFTTKDSQTRLTLDLVIFAKPDAMNITVVSSPLQRNPFCKPGILLPPKHLNPTAYCLDDLRLIAIVQQHDNAEAWLQGPNTTVVSVKRGMFFGKEQAKLSEVKADHIVWILSNHQSYLMRLN